MRELAEAESLAALPAAPYPAIIEVTRIVQANATVNYRGNRYSLPPGLSGSEVTLRNRLGSHGLEIVAASGAKIAEHRLAHDGSGMVIRDPGHAAALEKTVLAAFSIKRPCDKKANVAPSNASLDEAARLLGDVGQTPTVDLRRWAELVEATR